MKISDASDSTVYDISDTTFTIDTFPSVDDSSNYLPTEFSLSQNYPNPFNPSTTLRYTIPRSGQVTLRIYNLLGKEVETLVDEKQQAGAYAIQWNPVDLPSGIYFIRLQAGEFAANRKLLLVK